jgi:hypothetical protein
MLSLREKFRARRKDAPPMVRVTLSKVKPWKSYKLRMPNTEQTMLLTLRHVCKDGFVTCSVFLKSGQAFTTDVRAHHMVAIPEKEWNQHYKEFLNTREERLKAHNLLLEAQQEDETRQDLEQAQHDASQQELDQPQEEDFTNPDDPVAHNENPA